MYPILKTKNRQKFPCPLRRKLLRNSLTQTNFKNQAFPNFCLPKNILVFKQ